MDLKKHIVDIKDFPKTGVIFKDISPLLNEYFNEVVKQMGAQIHWDHVDAVVGIESRGFILGSGLAAHFGKGFIPVRKKGKLPPPVISHSYQLEYGSDTLEIKSDLKTKNVVIVDDVLATGGTLKATLQLCEKANLKVIDTLVLIDLKFLNKMDTVKSVIKYN